jgi:hypothetical protein
VKSGVAPGEQVEKVRRGSFGRPEWRPPVYETPLTVILAVQLARLLGWVVRACWRHPRAAVLVVAVLVIWASFGSLGLPGCPTPTYAPCVTHARRRLRPRWRRRPAMKGDDR